MGGTPIQGWKTILASLLAEHNAKAAGRDKPAGALTRKKRAEILFSGFAELRELGYKLNDPRHLKLKHVRALARKWEAEGQAPGTVQNKISVFRVFAAWIGKSGMVEESAALVADPASVQRSYATRTDKSWDGKVDFRAILERLLARDPHVAMQLELQHAFGLRSRESWLLRPDDDLRRDGPAAWLYITRGAKNGRPRHVPIETEDQWDVLRRASRLAAGGSMIPVGYTLKRWNNRYYYIMQAEGLTRKGLGVVPHGLRHGYVHRRYLAHLGVEAPIKGGGEPVGISKAAVRLARVRLSEEVGHSRPVIVGAYAGSPRAAKKPRLDWTARSGEEGKPRELG